MAHISLSQSKLLVFGQFLCPEREISADISLSRRKLLVFRPFLCPEREIYAGISLSRRGNGFRGGSDGGLQKNGTSPSKKAVFDGDRSFRGTSPSLGAMETSLSFGILFLTFLYKSFLQLLERR